MEGIKNVEMIQIEIFLCKKGRECSEIVLPQSLVAT